MAFKIDKKMGESRVSQIAGAVLLVAVFVFGLLYTWYTK